MGFFSATQLELSRGRFVGRERLYKFNFLEGMENYWTGWGNLVFDGDTYTGAGNIAQDSEIGFGTGDTAGDDTLTVSGVNDEFVRRVRESASVRGRYLYRYGLFFGEDLQPRDDKFLLKISIMDRVTFARQGPNVWTVTLHNESIWADRNGSANAYYSHKDQQARFPGDLGLERISLLAARELAWPEMHEA